MSRKVKRHGKKSKKKGSKKLKGNLNKKLFKSVQKELDNAFEFEKLEKLRSSYNLRNKKGEPQQISVAEFKAEGIDQLVPGLDKMVSIYGEENIAVNDKAYVPMLADLSLIDVEEVQAAVLALELMVNALIINTKKEKQIGAYRKVLKDTQKSVRFITKKFKKIQPNEKTEVSSKGKTVKNVNVRKELG